MKVWTDSAEPPDRDRAESGPSAYHSRLTLTFDPPLPDDDSGKQA
ncbi:hypothetical protein [Actinoplanes sp. NPDC051411]